MIYLGLFLYGSLINSITLIIPNVISPLHFV